MDEQTLTHEFAAAVRAEPPLGFDPDEIASLRGSNIVG